jgi:hypothetical protein
MLDENIRLGLHEEIMLLALHDKKGTIIGGVWHATALGGAILSELLLRGKLEIETDGKKSFVKLIDKKPTGDEVLDEAIQKIAVAKRRADAQTWVMRFSSMKNLWHRIARSLCDQKILRADERQLLLFFKQRIYPERNHGPERAIMGRLNDAVFTSAKSVDARTIVLVSLADASHLLPVLFDRKKLKERKEHIKKLVQGETVGGAARAAIQSAQAAIMVAAMVPIMIASTSH